MKLKSQTGKYNAEMDYILEETIMVRDLRPYKKAKEAHFLAQRVKSIHFFEIYIRRM